MLIIPAIDLMDNKCVRLVQGKFENYKVYFDDPLIPAEKYKDAGIKLLHIVDLDGARFGKMKNINIIQKIISDVKIDIEVGGGIRDIETIEKLINMGVNRIILGTKVIEDTMFIKKIKQYGNKIIIAVDLKDGKLSTRGWIKQSSINLNDFISILTENSINEIIVTDIKKDGMLTGVNEKFYKNLADKFPKINIIVSGGVHSIEDIEKIKKLNMPNIKGIIIGKALYEGTIKPEDL